MKYVQFPSGVIVSLHDIKMIGMSKITNGICFVYYNTADVDITLDKKDIEPTLILLMNFLMNKYSRLDIKLDN